MDMHAMRERLSEVLSTRRELEDEVEAKLAEKRKEGDARLAAHRDEILAAELALACVPKAYADFITSAGFDTQLPAVRAVEAFLASGRNMCVLHGTTGNGKTYAGAHACRVKGSFWLYADDYRAVGTYGEEAGKLRYRAHSAALLVFDDLMEKANDNDGHWKQKVLSLVDARLRGGQRTIITTNLDLRALGQEYGPRLSDRLRTATWVHCGNTSLRRQPT